MSNVRLGDAGRFLRKVRRCLENDTGAGSIDIRVESLSVFCTYLRGEGLC